uniref:Transposase n=1 Tax=Steinernema glaseri TaxID=37863 RepID=A0A1I7Y1V8_9BILA
MTRNSTKAILEKTNETTFLSIEDVLFTGVIANLTNVKLVQSVGIIPEGTLEQRLSRRFYRGTSKKQNPRSDAQRGSYALQRRHRDHNS